MNILHLDSSPSGTQSVTRKIGAAVVVALRDADPDARVTYRDLAAEPLAHLDGRLLAVLRPQPGQDAPIDAATRAEAARTEQVLAEFLAADVLVVGAPMVNFSVPSQLKAWIDRVAQAGRTFRYTASGPQGLAGGRKVIVVSARGSVYAGRPAEAAMDHQEAYLRAVFGFLGITDVEIVRAEGLGLGGDSRDTSIALALAHAREVAESVVPADVAA